MGVTIVFNACTLSKLRASFVRSAGVRYSACEDSSWVVTSFMKFLQCSNAALVTSRSKVQVLALWEENRGLEGKGFP
jgi:hypothetical protein